MEDNGLRLTRDRADEMTRVSSRMRRLALSSKEHSTLRVDRVEVFLVLLSTGNG
jgi:hypothetical protein